MKKSQKILAIGLTCLTVTSVVCMMGCSGNDATIEHNEHSGAGVSSICGLNYYNELVSLTTKHGIKEDDIISYSIVDYYNLNEGGNSGAEHKYSLCYDTKNSELYLARTEKFFIDGLGSQGESLTIYIDEYGIENNSFEWRYSDYDVLIRPAHSYNMSGTLNAARFSKSTDTLEYINSKFPESSNYTAASRAAKMAKDLIENVLVDILQKSDQKLTLSMLGFVRF